MSEKISKARAVRAASAKMKFFSEKKIQASLEFATDSLAEAYLIGAQEAQQEIIARIMAIKPS